MYSANLLAGIKQRRVYGGAGKQALIRGCLNGETYICEAYVPIYRGVYRVGTVRSETSQ